MLIIEILSYEICGMFFTYLISLLHNKVSIQEIIFAMSQVISSILFIKLYFNEIENINIEKGYIYGNYVIYISICHYLFDILILNIYNFDKKFKIMLTVHHVIGLLLFLIVWKYYKWYKITIFTVLIWRIGDIPQAFYKGWIIPDNILKNYIDEFGKLKVSIRLVSYFIPFIKNSLDSIPNETFSAIILQIFLQFILDFKTTFKFIKKRNTWLYFIFLMIFFIKN